MDINSKQLTCYVSLTYKDIAQLDFRKEIKINNNVYRIQKIVDWNTLGSCKVELFQVQPSPESVYKLPYGGINLLPVISGTTGGGVLYQKPKVINIQTLKPNYSNELITSGVNMTITGDTVDYKNHFSNTATGIIIGTGNNITDNNFFIKGNDNIITSNNNTIISSNNNKIQSDNVTLIKSSDNTIFSGITNLVLIGTTGLTLSTDNKVYLKNVDTDDLASTTYLTTNYYDKIDTDNLIIDATGKTLSDSFAYTNTKTGDTLTYVGLNYYDKTTADSTFASKSVPGTTYIKTTLTYATQNEYIIGENANLTGRTITLSDADCVNGKVFLIHDMRGSADTSAQNRITIQSPSIKQINGGSTVYLTTAFGIKTIWSDGSNWHCDAI